MEITVKELSQSYRYYKLTWESEEHRGMFYKTGVNKDILPFNPFGKCSKGGLYFFREDQLIYYEKFIPDAYWIREVTFPFPSEVRIWVEDYKYKANILFLSPRKKFIFYNVFEHIRNPSEELKLAAVSLDGWIIEYLDDPSEDVKLAAVRQHGWVIQHIKNPSAEVKLAAVQRHGDSIQHIEHPSKKIVLAAIRQNGIVIGCIENPSVSLQLEAIKQNKGTIVVIKNPCEEAIQAARGL